MLTVLDPGRTSAALSKATERLHGSRRAPCQPNRESGPRPSCTCAADRPACARHPRRQLPHTGPTRRARPSARVLRGSRNVAPSRRPDRRPSSRPAPRRPGPARPRAPRCAQRSPRDRRRAPHTRRCERRPAPIGLVRLGRSPAPGRTLSREPDPRRPRVRRRLVTSPPARRLARPPRSPTRRAARAGGARPRRRPWQPGRRVRDVGEQDRGQYAIGRLRGA